MQPQAREFHLLFPVVYQHKHAHLPLALPRYVYERIAPRGRKPGFQSLLFTQLVSAVWHGLYAGYMLFFAGTAVWIYFSQVGRRVRGPAWGVCGRRGEGVQGRLVGEGWFGASPQSLSLGVGRRVLMDGLAPFATGGQGPGAQDWGSGWVCCLPERKEETPAWVLLWGCPGAKACRNHRPAVMDWGHATGSRDSLVPQAHVP